MKAIACDLLICCKESLLWATTQPGAVSESPRSEEVTLPQLHPGLRMPFPAASDVPFSVTHYGRNLAAPKTKVKTGPQHRWKLSLCFTCLCTRKKKKRLIFKSVGKGSQNTLSLLESVCSASFRGSTTHGTKAKTSVTPDLPTSTG